MNKSELIEIIAKETGLSKVKAGESVDAFISAIISTLKGGDSVTLIGFGSFSTAKRAARVGRNPKTGKEIRIAATDTPKFKAGKGFKEAISKKK